MNKDKKELGPVYGVELISTLKLHGGVMMQAMPSRSDLQRAVAGNMRVVAGYEVLLSKYHGMLECLRLLLGFDHLDDLTTDIISKAIDKAEESK